MNQETTATTPKPLDEQFFAIVENQIDEKGVYPLPGLVRNCNDEIEFAMITEVRTAFHWFWKKVHDESVLEVILGIDRTTRPGQGTEFDDVLTVVHWKHDEPIRFGVINYQHEPRIVRPMDWHNEFWNEKLGKEFHQFANFKPAKGKAV